MRVLFLNQFFWPDAAPTGKLLGDVAEELQTQGHSVTVLASKARYTGQPNTPEPNIKAVRVPTFSFSRHPLARVASWVSFLIFAFVRAIFLGRQDMVVAMTTPPGLSLVAQLLCGLWGAKLWIWEMDLYPDVAEGAGTIKPGGWSATICRTLLNASRRRAHGIIVLGECMRDRLIAQGIPAAKLALCENWADDIARPVRASTLASPLRILYSGNLGLAHEADTIARVMLSLKDNANIEFVFCGGGKRRPGLEKFARDHAIGNVKFLGFLEEESFSQQMVQAQIGLITLRESCLGTVVPSKMYPLMAAGMPILFIGPPEAATARSIEAYCCGWHARPGSADEVVALLLKLSRWPELVESAARQSRLAFLEKYDGKVRVPQLCQLLSQAGMDDSRPAVMMAESR